MKDKIETILAVLTVLVILWLVIFLQPLIEAKVFNRCTGSHATVWTAMFTELRVTECNKGNATR